MNKLLLTYVIPTIIIVLGVIYLSVKSKELFSFSDDFYRDSTSQSNSENEKDDANGSSDKALDNDLVEVKMEINASDVGAIGSMNHAYLSSEVFEKLYIEIDHVLGSAPSEKGRLQASSTMGAYADKPGGIEYVGSNLVEVENGLETYSYDQIIEIMNENRNVYSSDNTASLYILYLNGEFLQNPSAIGVSINATSFVVFKEKIENIATTYATTEDVERSVVAHEIGHLWGLVNVNYQSEIDHEDPDSPNHSESKVSVMYWAIESDQLTKVIRETPSFQFDSADREDIEKIKSGEY